MSVLRKCVTCGKEYEFCMGSSYDVNKAWKNTFDSVDCRDIFNICSDYSGEIISAAEAKDKLNKLTIPSNLTNSVRKFVDKINAEATKSVPKPAPKVEVKPVEAKV